MKNTENVPILVTGIQRSGTSIIAQILQTCGVFCGNTTDMKENNGIKKLVDNYYEGGGMDVRGQFPLPDTQALWIPSNWKESVLKRVTNEGYRGERQWMYKNFRICQIWPVWNYAFPNAKWIVVRRRTPEIIKSCLDTDYMNAFKDYGVQQLAQVSGEKEGWLWWIHKHEQYFREMIYAGANCKMIWPERMMRGDYSQVYEMLEWLGLDWNPEILKLIDPLWWNGRKKERS